MLLTVGKCLGGGGAKPRSRSHVAYERENAPSPTVRPLRQEPGPEGTEHLPWKSPPKPGRLASDG